MKLSPLLAVLATGTLLAQRPPLPGIPITPVTDHPALAAQPLMQPKPEPKPADPPAPTPGAKPAPAPIDPDTTGPQLTGKDLADAVGKALALPWHTKLATAQAEAATTGKPILWLQALGTLDGPRQQRAAEPARDHVRQRPRGGRAARALHHRHAPTSNGFRTSVCRSATNTIRRRWAHQWRRRTAMCRSSCSPPMARWCTRCPAIGMHST